MRVPIGVPAEGMHQHRQRGCEDRDVGAAAERAGSNGGHLNEGHVVRGYHHHYRIRFIQLPSGPVLQ